MFKWNLEKLYWRIPEGIFDGTDGGIPERILGLLCNGFPEIICDKGAT